MIPHDTLTAETVDALLLAKQAKRTDSLHITASTIPYGWNARTKRYERLAKPPLTKKEINAPFLLTGALLAYFLCGLVWFLCMGWLVIDFVVTPPTAGFYLSWIVSTAFVWFWLSTKKK